MSMKNLGKNYVRILDHQKSMDAHEIGKMGGLPNVELV